MKTNHRRVNKPDGHHHPWVFRFHCYNCGHRGAALGRKFKKTLFVRRTRRKLKRVTDTELVWS